MTQRMRKRPALLRIKPRQTFHDIAHGLVLVNLGELECKRSDVEHLFPHRYHEQADAPTINLLAIFFQKIGLIHLCLTRAVYNRF